MLYLAQKFIDLYLIFDVSANGMPKKWDAAFHDVFNWPRMIHISWITLDKDFKPLLDYNCYVKPKGFNLTEEQTKKCSVDLKELNEKGLDIKDVLMEFNNSLKDIEYVFAHNLNFNENVIAAEYYRAGEDHQLFNKERFCLMQESTWYCKLKGRDGKYKWPSLNELHAVLFNQKYTPSNNARADVIAASRCFIKLMKMGQLDDIF